MKPRNREINIFNLSMMDVISGALGAFLIIVIILFPYYKKETIDYRKQNLELKQKLEEKEADLQKAEEALNKSESEKQQMQEALTDCKEKLSQTFLVVLIKWKTTKQDIDLHVIDPSGAEFSFDKKTIPGRPGELSEDDLSGPGNEIWEIRNAPPGNYRIYYNLYDRHGNSENPVIQGRVFFREGSKELPGVRLTAVKVKKAVVTITVKADGDVEIR